jgi:hypothetical protein
MRTVLMCSMLALAAGLVTLPSTGFAQASDPPGQRGDPGNRGSRPPMPNLPPQSNAPPRPRGLGGQLPPGHGGPSPREGAGGSDLRDEILGRLRVCAPGGALSGTPENGQQGRSRARALVCGD